MKNDNWIYNIKYTHDGNAYIELRKYTGPSGDILIPAIIGGYKVMDINDEAFRFITVTDVVFDIECQIPFIRKETFRNQHYLKQILLPDSIEMIQPWAFQGCTRLEIINTPAKLESIGEFAFSNCEMLKTLPISDKLVNLGEQAFLGTVNAAVPVTLPPTFKHNIRFGVFENSGITSIDMSNTCIEHINEYAFLGCRNLTDAVLSDKTKTVGSKAFKNCSSLQNISLGDSLTEIKSEAFRNCSSLEKIIGGKNIRKIYENVFDGVNNMKHSVYFPKLTSVQDCTLGFNNANSNLCIKTDQNNPALGELLLSGIHVITKSESSLRSAVYRDEENNR